MLIMVVDSLNATCPICNTKLDIPAIVEAQKITSCTDCYAELIIEKITSDQVLLAEAPAAEIDW